MQTHGHIAFWQKAHRELCVYLAIYVLVKTLVEASFSTDSLGDPDDLPHHPMVAEVHVEVPSPSLPPAGGCPHCLVTSRAPGNTQDALRGHNTACGVSKGLVSAWLPLLPCVSS